jgi:peptide/nickel transport system substrate-binding protein
LSDESPNRANYSNSEVTRLLADAGGELDNQLRADKIIEAQTIAARDLPYCPMWWGKSALAVSNGIGIADYSAYTFVTPWANAIFATS